MRKYKIGIYYDLPFGGARRLMDGIASIIAKSNKLYNLPTLKSSKHRLYRDLKNFLGTYLYALKLKRIIEKNNLDFLLVSHDSFFAAPAILALSPVPTIFYCHEPTRALYEKNLDINQNWPLINQIYERLYRFVKKILERYNAKKATIILTNSHYTKSYIMSAYGRTANVLYPGIDTNSFSPSSYPKTNSVLVVGNDEPQKRLKLAIKVLSYFPSNVRPKLNLVCPRFLPSKKLVHYAKNLGVKLNVYVGISDHTLRKLYQQSIATLVPAMAEPFGLSAAESLACGTPVIATNEGGVTEIISDGETGYLCPADPHEFFKKIKYLVDHKQLAKKMGEKGRARIKSHFGTDQFAIAIAQISSAKYLFESHKG